MQNSLQEDHNRIDELVEEFEKKLKIEHNNDTEKEMYSNSIQMCRKVLAMELNIIEIYFNHKLIEMDNDTLNEIQKLKTSLDFPAAPDNNDFVYKADNLSTELMKKIKNLIYKKADNDKEIKNSIDDIEVPDYRSIVTVRGTEEDVINCITRAETALVNGNYDRAKSFLLKAERILPTKNARDLLKQVRAAKEAKQYSDHINHEIEVEEQIKTIKEVISISEDDSMNAIKCLTAFKQALISQGISRNLQKAMRMLNKAKRLDPSLDTEEELSLVKNVITERLLLLTTELTSSKELLEINEDTLMDEKYDIRTHIGNAHTALDMNNFEKAENDLSLAEKSNVDLMNKIKEKSDKKTIKTEEGMKPKDDIEVSDSKSMVVDRCIQNTVVNCILSAETTLKNGKYDKAESLLLKAEKIFPTQIAKYLLNQVRAAKERKQNTEHIEQAIEAEEQDNTVKEEKSISDDDSINAGKCLTAFKQSFIAGNFEKADRMLNKAKRLNPSLDMVKELSLAKATITNSEDVKQTEIDITLRDATNIRNTEIKLYSTARLNEEQKNISEIHSPEETNVPSNCYEFPVKANESNNLEASKCVEIARAAFEANQYDKAERFLLKSLRICDSQKAQLLLKIVHSSKANNNTKVPIQKKSNNEYEHDYSLTTKAITEGNRTKNDASKQLKHNEDVRASQSKADDLNRERAAKVCIQLAMDVMEIFKFHVARHYLERALKIGPNKETMIIVRDVEKQVDIRSERGSVCLSEDDFMLEANRLLVETGVCIRLTDFDNAEYLLTISWDMYESQRTTLVYQELLKAQIAHFSKEAENRPYRRNDQIQYYRLVESAIKKYQKKDNDEAERILMRAFELYQSSLLEQFLFVVRGTKTTKTKPKWFQFWHS